MFLNHHFSCFLHCAVVLVCFLFWTLFKGRELNCNVAMHATGDVMVCVFVFCFVFGGVCPEAGVQELEGQH